MRTLDISGDIALIDGTFRVVSTAGSQLRLKNLATGEQSTIHLADLLPRLTEMPVLTSVSPRTLNAIPAPLVAKVDAMAAHLEEMITGRRPGHDTPRPEYDPATTSLNKRVEAKVVALRLLGIPASRASLLRKKKAFLEAGAAGVVDKRHIRQFPKFDRTDERVVQAICAVMARQANATTVTQSRLHRLVHEDLLQHHQGEDVPEMPSSATMYRHFEALGKKKYTTGKATSRRSAANAPKRTHGTALVLLPGEEVQVDSTKMDLLVRTKDGPKRPLLTIMLDRAIRSIISSTIRLEGTKGYDHALLLAKALVPPSQRPDRTDHRALVAARHPEHPLLSDTERKRLERTQPSIYPRRIMMDNGADYTSNVFASACAKFGIDPTLSAPYTPTDKAMVERNFGTISTMFTQNLPGYVGNSPVNKGRNPQKAELLDIATLSELFDDWVLNVWQSRPHSGLRDPMEPSQKYSPNQWFNATTELAGTIPLPITQDDFIDLLPSGFRNIGTVGVQFKNRHYDSVELHPHRHLPSNLPGHKRLWEVKYNPYDVTHIWVRSPKNTWIECRWRNADALTQPFFGDVADNLRKVKDHEERDETARTNAYLAGTAMPLGAPEPELNIAPQHWDDGSVADLDMFDPDEE